ncbi:MAG: tyrosine-type recombinase/integrase [Veillonellales bacterium]
MATVQKRGNSWRLIAYLGYDSSKKQIRKTKTIPADGITKPEAKRMANEFENECLKKGFINDQNLTVKDFIDYWKREYALQPDIYSPKTLERNEDLLNRIIPAIGSIRLKKLKPTHLMEFYNNLREDGMRLDGKKGKLSSRTIQMHHRLLSAILNKAKQWQFIEINPCQHVDAPKSKSKSAPIYDEQTLLRFFQILFAEAKTKYQVFFLLDFSTGLRRGEMVGLRWNDINIEKAVLHVNQSAIAIKGKGIIYKDPKTEKSKNGVSFPRQLIPIIEKYREEQEILKSKCKTKWPDNDLVFKTAEGRQMFPSTFSHWLTDFIEKHNLPHISPHSFRHMSVTYAIDRGFDLKAVSERARHTQVSTTTDIYAHVLPQKDQAIAACLGEIIDHAKDTKDEKQDKK